MQDTPVELIAEARRSLRQVERLLLDPTPRDLVFCCAAMAEARERVERLRDELSSPTETHTSLRSPVLLEAAARLRGQVSSIGVLLDRAASFHGGLLQCMMEAAQNASPSPTPQQTAPRVHISM